MVVGNKSLARMKKYLLIICCLIGLCSCSEFTYKFTKLKNKYQETVMTDTLNMNYNTVWYKLIDFIADNNINVRILDKESGLIMTEKINFNKKYTYEDKNGNPLSKDRYIICGNQFQGATQVHPNSVTGFLIFQLKQSTKSNILKVNLIDEIGVFDYSTNSLSSLNFECVSTGVLEKQIFDSVKKEN